MFHEGVVDSTDVSLVPDTFASYGVQDIAGDQVDVGLDLLFGITLSYSIETFEQRVQHHQNVNITVLVEVLRCVQTDDLFLIELLMTLYP